MAEIKILQSEKEETYNRLNKYTLISDDYSKKLVNTVLDTYAANGEILDQKQNSVKLGKVIYEKIITIDPNFMLNGQSLATHKRVQAILSAYDAVKVKPSTTNTNSAKNGENPDPPKTEDSDMSKTWLICGGIALITVGAIYFKKKRNSKSLSDGKRKTVKRKKRVPTKKTY